MLCCPVPVFCVRLRLRRQCLTLEGALQEQYQAALEAAPDQAAQQRAVYLANSAAARLKLEEFSAAASDCSAALALEPAAGLQIKALTRRSQAYEKLDELDRALADYEKVRV